MRRRDGISDSDAERRIFERLDTWWSDRFFVAPLLPLTKLFDIASDEVSCEQWRFYLNADVDFTICEKGTLRPIASIEFDGLGGGFSRDGRYIPERTPREDPQRGPKLLLKLRLAEEVDFPFLVVSYPETPVLAGGEYLTILGGVVAQLVGEHYFQDKLDEFLGPLDGENLPPAQLHELQADAVLSAEGELALECDPLSRAARRAGYEFEERTGFAGHASWEYVCDPTLPDFSPSSSPFHQLDVVMARAEAFGTARRVGCAFTVAPPEGSPVTRTVYVRNVSARGLSAEELARHIAEYMAYRAALGALPP